MFLIPSLCHMLNNVIKYKFYDFMYVKAANSCFVSTINLTSAITASCVIIVRNFSSKHNNQPDEVSVFLLPHDDSTFLSAFLSCHLGWATCVANDFCDMDSSLSPWEAEERRQYYQLHGMVISDTRRMVCEGHRGNVDIVQS